MRKLIELRNLICARADFYALRTWNLFLFPSSELAATFASLAGELDDVESVGSEGKVVWVSLWPPEPRTRKENLRILQYSAWDNNWTRYYDPYAN